MPSLGRQVWLQVPDKILGVLTSVLMAVPLPSAATAGSPSGVPDPALAAAGTDAKASRASAAAATSSVYAARAAVERHSDKQSDAPHGSGAETANDSTLLDLPVHRCTYFLPARHHQPALLLPSLRQVLMFVAEFFDKDHRVTDALCVGSLSAEEAQGLLAEAQNTFDAVAQVARAALNSAGDAPSIRGHIPPHRDASSARSNSLPAQAGACGLAHNHEATGDQAADDPAQQQLAALQVVEAPWLPQSARRVAPVPQLPTQQACVHRCALPESNEHVAALYLQVRVLAGALGFAWQCHLNWGSKSWPTVFLLVCAYTPRCCTSPTL